jgi:WD40 repeat protein
MLLCAAVWDLAMMRCAQTLKGHKSSVRCVQFDDTRIVSGSWDNTIKVRLPLCRLDAVKSAFRADYKLVGVGQLWDVNTYRNTDTLQGHSNKLMCLQFDETKIISGAQDKTIVVWDLHTGKQLVCITHKHTLSLSTSLC